MRSNRQGPDLVPYGHPQTWPGDLLRTGLTFDAARAMLRARARFATTPGPGPGYVLGIDEASTSGYGLVELERRKVILSGTVHGDAEAAELIQRINERIDLGTLLVVLEDHRFLPAKADPTAVTAHDRTVRHNKKLIALGRSAARWEMGLTMLGHPQDQRLMVQPRMWRRVMGTRVNLARDAWKAQAMLYASAVLGQPVKNADRAEGVCIAIWGSWDGLYQWASLVKLRERGALPENSNARANLRGRGVSR
jgi:hypothetical protein